MHLVSMKTQFDRTQKVWADNAPGGWRLRVVPIKQWDNRPSQHHCRSISCSKLYLVWSNFQPTNPLFCFCQFHRIHYLKKDKVGQVKRERVEIQENRRSISSERKVDNNWHLRRCIHFQSSIFSLFWRRSALLLAQTCHLHQCNPHQWQNSHWFTYNSRPQDGPTDRPKDGPLAFGPSGVLDFVLWALRALRSCDPRNIDWIVC